MKSTLLTALLLAGTNFAIAQPAAQPVPDAAPPPPPPYQGESVEPQVNIIQSEKGTIYEYRVHGQVYMVKVKPVVGPPYYLLDTNGDGILDTQQPGPANNAVNQWLLFSW
jgi:hypothetical protein